jgi:hypothetical protein
VLILGHLVLEPFALPARLLAFVEDLRAVVLVVVAVVVLVPSSVVVSSVSVVCCMVVPKAPATGVSARPRAADRYRTIRVWPTGAQPDRDIQRRPCRKSRIASALVVGVGHHPGPRSLCFGRGLGFIDAE